MVARVVLLVLLLHGAALYYYTSGFLLARFELPFTSHCSTPPAPGVPHAAAAVPTTHGCWMPKRFERLVFIVIDALRFDFAHYDPSRVPIDASAASSAGSTTASASRFYHNGLPILHQLQSQRTSKTLFFRSIADSPTVTMQRIKALMTGGLPTFVDVGDLSFQSNHLTEDNLIHQLVSTGRHAVLLGDDTWLQMFPTSFERHYEYPSFNAKDLHTVDNGVIEHLVPELLRCQRRSAATNTTTTNANAESRYDPTCWHMLIAHFLGVDHVGHRYGPNHPEMAAKLLQLNRVLEQVVPLIDDDTLLVITGDHGMTEDGNHGGSSDDESITGLLFYSNRTINPFGTYTPDPASVRTISQIDLTATFSLLLGVPIPFANLGQVIPELIMGLDASVSAADTLTRAKSKSAGVASPATEALLAELNRRASAGLEALWLNVRQVWQYITAYTKHSKQFSSEDLASLEYLYERARAAIERDSLTRHHVANQSASGSNPREAFEHTWHAIHEARAFLTAALEVCRIQWATFDLDQMKLGIALLLESLLVLLLHLLLARSDHTYFVPSKWAALLVVAIGASVAAATSGTAIDPRSARLPWLLSLVSLLYCTELVVSEGRAFVRSLVSAATTAIRHPVATVASELQLVFAFVSVVLHGIGLFSNSFIEQEASVVRFLLQSTVAVTIICRCYIVGEAPPQAGVLWRLALAAVCIKASSYAVKGRHEQYQVDGGLLLVGELARTFVPLLLAVLTNHGRRLLHGRSQCEHRSSLLRVVELVSVAFVATYWALQRLGDDAALPHAELITAARMLLPRAVYVATLLAIATSVLLAMRSSNGGAPGSAATVQLFERLYRALWPSVTLVLGPNGSMAMLLMDLETASVGYALNASPTTAGASRRSWSLSTAVCWSLMTLQFFFATGHDWSFSDLQFEAAFIGFEQFNYLAGSTLLTLNTFASAVMLAVALPATVVPFSAARDNEAHRHLSSAILAYVAFFAVTITLTAIFVLIERRHLMMWRVFAPKYVFDAAFVLVLDVLALLVAALLFLVSVPSSPLPPSSRSVEAKADKRQ